MRDPDESQAAFCCYTVTLETRNLGITEAVRGATPASGEALDEPKGGADPTRSNEVAAPQANPKGVNKREPTKDGGHVVHPTASPGYVLPQGAGLAGGVDHMTTILCWLPFVDSLRV